jgi:hypothetical protein
METAGFYKKDENGEWLYAPNFVYSPNFELVKENKDTYTYPVDGWNWYDEQPYEDIKNNNLTEL